MLGIYLYSNEPGPFTSADGKVAKGGNCYYGIAGFPAKGAGQSHGFDGGSVFLLLGKILNAALAPCPTTTAPLPPPPRPPPADDRCALTWRTFTQSLLAAVPTAELALFLVERRALKAKRPFQTRPSGSQSRHSQGKAAGSFYGVLSGG